MNGRLLKRHKNMLIARCGERGYRLEDVMPCVVIQDGDMWTIDVDHPAYPHKIEPNSSTATAQNATITKELSRAYYVCND